MERFSQISWRIGKTLLSLALAFFTGILANKVTGKSDPFLSVETVSSTTAGRTVTDITIENVGDVSLVGLRMHVVFSSAVDVGVQPRSFSSCAVLQSSDFKLQCLPNIVLAPSQVVSLRFTSKAEHSIVDSDKIIQETSAFTAQSPVQARLRRNDLIRSILKGDILFLALLVVAVALVAALIVLLAQKALAQFRPPPMEKGRE